jgi:hypothetical protein
MPMGKGSERNLFRVKSWRTIGKGAHRTVKYGMEEFYNFQHRKTRTKARPWFNPACEKAARDAQKIFNSQMKKLGM